MVGLLQQSNIEVTVENENMQGAVGEIPFTHVYPELHLVDERDEARATAIIHDYETSRLHLKTVICHGCGEENPANFSSCWACDMMLSES